MVLEPFFDPDLFTIYAGKINLNLSYRIKNLGYTPININKKMNSFQLNIKCIETCKIFDCI